jgi:hypothetical protein
MTNEEILKAAIEKSKKFRYSDSLLEEEGYYSIIFDHEFAKAFWGDEVLEFTKNNDGSIDYQGFSWQYHLKKMVLKEEPLKYLETFL